MRKTLMMAAATMAAVLTGVSAQATPIAAGGSVTAAPLLPGSITVLATYSDVAFSSQATSNQTSAFSGTYTASVFRDTNNTLCSMAGQCLTFGIEVNNSSRSRDGIETVMTGPFSSLFTYNVGYNGFNSGVAPINITDSAFGIISFNFTTPSNSANLIAPGAHSDILLIQSSATNFTTGSISFQDSQTATVAGFIPTPAIVAAVPESATWAMMILGVGVIGFSMRSAKRRSDAKFDAKIIQITEGATA